MWNALFALTLLGVGRTGLETVRADSQHVVLELHPRRDRYRASTELYVTLTQPARYLALDLDGIEPSQVEMIDPAGRVELIWGERPAGTLLLEMARDPVPGPAIVRIAFDRAYADSGIGLVREGRGASARIRSNFEHSGARAAFPCMPGVQGWSLTIEAPTAWRITTNLRRTREGLSPGYRTSAWRSTRAVAADSLRISVTPR